MLKPQEDYVKGPQIIVSEFRAVEESDESNAVIRMGLKNAGFLEITTQIPITEYFQM